MDQISPVAWVVIILFVLFIIGLNVSLFNALRSPNRPKIKMDREPPETVEAVRRLGTVLRDPLANERIQLNALSDLVHDLEKPAPEDQLQGASKEDNR